MKNEQQLSFSELKERVSVIDVASFLGYQFDRTKGVTQPSFVLSDNNGDILDRIYIKNPNDNSRQGYWRRNGIQNTGDVISFVKENINRFGVSGRNEIDIVNKVLHKFAGMELKAPPQGEYANRSRTELTFDKSRWIDVYSPQVRDKIFSSRGISPLTTLSFSKHIQTIQDKEQNGRYTYIGFPYTIPGSNSIVGYELRGVNGFKSKASGTNSTEGMWLATFTNDPLQVKTIYIAESAFDALAYAQIHRDRINLATSAFVSFGGSFSDKQFLGLKENYSSARMVLLFDRDLNGNMYDIRATALYSGDTIQAKMTQDNVHFNVKGRSFDIPSSELSSEKFSELSGINIPTGRLEVLKPTNGYKDWNDILMANINTPSKYEIKR